MDVAKVWQEAIEKVKDRIMHPTLWRALDLGVAICLENDQFVVGMVPGSTHLAGHLRQVEHKLLLEQSIAAIIGKKVNLTVIDGASREDWESFKLRQKAAEEARKKAREKIVKESAVTQTWDGVMEQVGRAYAATQLKQLPQIRGKYILKSIELISDAMDQLYNEENPDEPSQRALARVIDRVGVLTEVPAAVIALELARYRQDRRNES